MTAVTKSGVGAIVWGAFLGFCGPSRLDSAWAHGLLLFSALVLVPLALELVVETDETGAPAQWLALVRRWQFPAAFLLAVACGLSSGLLAAGLAMPWVVVTAGLAVVGLARVKRAQLRRPLDGLCADAALIFLGVGGGWVLVERAGLSPLGFDSTIVTLTAVHFHYAGLVLPLVAGRVQRELFFWRFPAQAAVGVVLGVPAVAFGITATKLGWGHNLEEAAGCGLALAGMAVAVLQVRIALESKRPVLTRWLLGVSGASLFFGMVLAGLYAMGASVIVPWLGIPQMRLIHGTVNAIGFGLCGVIAWRRMGPADPV